MRTVPVVILWYGWYLLIFHPQMTSLDNELWVSLICRCEVLVHFQGRQFATLDSLGQIFPVDMVGTLMGTEFYQILSSLKVVPALVLLHLQKHVRSRNVLSKCFLNEYFRNEWIHGFSIYTCEIRWCEYRLWIYALGRKRGCAQIESRVV